MNSPNPPVGTPVTYRPGPHCEPVECVVEIGAVDLMTFLMEPKK